MKKLFLSPLFGPIVAIIAFTIFGFCAWYSYFNGLATFMHDWQAGDIWTYLMYVLAFSVILFFMKDFKGKYDDYVLFLFLMLCGLFREAGVQHLLTQTDSTAFKTRFFTNPNNPLWEKCRAGFLLVVVLGAGALVLIKYFPKIWHGFWKQNPVYWTICTLGCVGVLCKICDRWPSRYYSIFGEDMSKYSVYWFSVGEEGLEMTLPLLIAIAVYQHHLLKKRKLTNS